MVESDLQTLDWPTPVKVTPLPDYSIAVEFSDGVSGEVNLSQLVGKGVFKAWDDVERFNSVYVDEYGAIAWGDELDICADSLYMEITGLTVEEFLGKIQSPPLENA